MIGNHESSAMGKNMPVKIAEDEESGEEEAGTTKGVGHPGIHVIIGPGGRIIGDHRRSVFIIITVNYFRTGVHRGPYGIC